MRILVVDDHELIRRGIGSVLSAEPTLTVCGEAVDGRDAVEKSMELRPDLVIMDISMPNMNGLQATQEIKRLLPETKVVIVSQHQGPEIIRQTSNAGAAGYVAKSEISSGLLAAIAKCGNHQTTADHAKRKSSQTAGERPASNSPDAAGGGEGLNSPERGSAPRAVSRPPADSPSHLDLGGQNYLTELLPMAAYAVRAPDGVIAWFNSRAVQLWGRTPAVGDTDERFCGAHKLYRADGSFMAHCDTPVALALRTGVSVHEQEVVIERPDGSRVTVAVHIDPIRDKDGRVVGAVNFFRDITEQRNAERTAGLLAAIVDSSDDAIISKNLDGVISSWNEGAQRTFGYAAEEAIGRHISLIIPPERRGEEVSILEKVKRGERVDHFETVRVRKDGTPLDISVTISPVKDAAGRIIGASKVARDITGRKRAEEEVRKQEEKLRELAGKLENEVRLRTQDLERRNADVLQQSEQLRELSSRLLQTQDEERRHIARELHDSAGQILSGLGMNLALIKRNAKPGPVLDRAIQDCEDLNRQLNKEIRTMSYLLHPPLLDERGLAGAIPLYVEGLAERSGLRIDLSVPQNFGRLPAEMELTMFRILQECLTNIHRHSDSDDATIRLSRNADTVSLEIQDAGKGIPAKKLSQIKAQRSGVGITGMRERVRHLKGAMDIQSNGTGTTISVTLPVAMTTPAEWAAAAPAQRES